ncbi:hypothetical protein [Streptomyces vilmorinianum]|uniref:hypothetical protein n=1 Tax=Streptomyces vilmorinianum TaxID=3051092 RepID=UPI0010FB4A41|nr:hypothetical protein [Streptomyces vilmorinianum]
MAYRSQDPTTRSKGPFVVPTLRGSWLTRGVEGRFSAYLPWGGEVVRWTEGPDGRWSDAVSLGGGGLLPILAVGQGADRYVHLVGLRPVPGEEGHVELVHSTQFQTGRPAVEWRSIQHSNGKSFTWTGNPAVAVDAQGRAYVFTRNGGGGLSVRAQKDGGGWHPWWDLWGNRSDPSPVAATNGAGLVELYTAKEEGLLRYEQQEPGAKPVRHDVVPASVTFGSLAAVTGPSGHVSLYYVDKEGRICVWTPGRSPEPRPFLDAVGEGPLSATRCRIDGVDCTVLAQQSADGRLALAAFPVEQESAGAKWTETGEPQVPLLTTLTQALDGGLVAMTVGDGPRLLTTRQKPAAEGLQLGTWRSVI